MPNGLNTVMLVLAGEDKTNKYLIAAFQYDQDPDTNPSPQITFVKDNVPAPYQTLIGPPQARFMETSFKPQSILQDNKNDSIQ